MPSFVGNARLIGAVTLLSRILGMARDILASHFLGAGLVWDAFALAQRVPNLFRRLFGEGALTSAFVPAFVSRIETDRRNEAFALLRRLATALGLLLAVIVAIGIAITYTFPADQKSRLEAEYLRIMLPYLVLICVGAIYGAALNGLRHFFMPAFAPVIANVVGIGAILLFAGRATEDIGRMLAWSVLIGGILQLLSMAVLLRAKGASLAPDVSFRDPALREVGAQFAPLVLGLSLVQINEFLNTIIAKLCVEGNGAVSALYYGNQLTQFPLSLVGGAIAVAIFPEMASAAAKGKLNDLSHLVDRGIRGTLYLSIPATVGLIVLAHPILQLIFEHGEFGPESTTRAAQVMIFYSLSLWCYCANQVQVRAFYALGDTRTPVRVAVSMVLLTLGLGFVLVHSMREAGISLATSIGGLLSFMILQVLLRRRVTADYGSIVKTFLLSLAVSALMGAAAWAVHRYTPTDFIRSVIAARLLRVGLAVVVGAGLYFGITMLLRMPEARQVLRRRP